MRLIKTTLVAVMATLMIAGCSQSQAAPPDPATLLAKATANARAASSVHVTGSGGCTGTAFKVDMQLRKDGVGAGQVTLGNTVLSLVTTPTKLFVNAPQDFWTAQANADAAKAIGTKWVDMPQAGNPCLVALGTMKNVLDNYLGQTGTPTLVSGSTYNGQPARLVAVGTTVGIWLSNAETSYPLAVKSPDTSTDISFADWGAAVEVVIPPAHDVISTATLPKK